MWAWERIKTCQRALSGLFSKVHLRHKTNSCFLSLPVLFHFGGFQSLMMRANVVLDSLRTEGLISELERISVLGQLWTCGAVISPFIVECKVLNAHSSLIYTLGTYSRNRKRVNQQTKYNERCSGSTGKTFLRGPLLIPHVKRQVSVGFRGLHASHSHPSYLDRQQ